EQNKPRSAGHEELRQRAPISELEPVQIRRRAGQKYEAGRDEVRDPAREEHTGRGAAGGDARVHTHVIDRHEDHDDAAHDVERHDAAADLALWHRWRIGARKHLRAYLGVGHWRPPEGMPCGRHIIPPVRPDREIGPTRASPSCGVPYALPFVPHSSRATPCPPRAIPFEFSCSMRPCGRIPSTATWPLSRRTASSAVAVAWIAPRSPTSSARYTIRTSRARRVSPTAHRRSVAG